jgi:hypothetical protein
MPTKVDDNSSGSIDDGQAVSAVFNLLSHHRRRVAIRYLATQVGTTTVADVADQIALLEGQHTNDRYARICVSLVHNHLPMMEDAALIEFDRDQGVIEMRDQPAEIISHLELVNDTDISEESV